eukprot:EG_transcript_1152
MMAPRIPASAALPFLPAERLRNPALVAGWLAALPPKSFPTATAAPPTPATAARPCAAADAADAGDDTGSGGSSQPLSRTNVYIARLPKAFSDEQLAALFQPFGLIDSCRVMNNGNKRAAVGFVQFTDPASATAAVNAMNGQLVQGRKILVRPADRDRDVAPAAPSAEDMEAEPPQPEEAHVMHHLLAMGGKGLNPWTLLYAPFPAVATPSARPPTPPTSPANPRQDKAGASHPATGEAAPRPGGRLLPGGLPADRRGSLDARKGAAMPPPIQTPAFPAIPAGVPTRSSLASNELKPSASFFQQALFPCSTSPSDTSDTPDAATPGLSECSSSLWDAPDHDSLLSASFSFLDILDIDLPSCPPGRGCVSDAFWRTPASPCLRVSNLPLTTTKTQLYDLCSQFGSVVQAKLYADEEGSVFALVLFNTAKDAHRAELQLPRETFQRHQLAAQCCAAASLDAALAEVMAAK